jgi:hypothetical protein
MLDRSEYIEETSKPHPTSGRCRKQNDMGMDINLPLLKTGSHSKSVYG